MGNEFENLVRAYRQMWRQDIDQMEGGKLQIVRDGADVTAATITEYKRRVEDISAMLDRLSNA